MADVLVIIEQRRGCGHRRPGKSGYGIYLIGPAANKPCGRIPFPLSRCPCCGGGIKPARGFTFIEPARLFGPADQAPECSIGRNRRNLCPGCPMGAGRPDGQHGLIWIGERYYKTPADFMHEAATMGVSRKLGKVPRDFVLGETWVYLAHRCAVPVFEEGNGITYEPGVFTAFLPTGIDLVIADEHKVPEKAERLAEHVQKKAKGGEVRLVKVIPEQEAQQGLEARA